jgi:hypothetical protein
LFNLLTKALGQFLASPARQIKRHRSELRCLFTRNPGWITL